MEHKSRQCDPEQWVDQYGNALYRYALPRLRDHEAAEDVVQETFIAALVSHKNFAGKSSQLTWLTGILKHKLIDYIRKHQKKMPLEQEKMENLSFEELFDQKGRWKNPPSNWMSDPSEFIEKIEFWKAFEKCLDAMPRHFAHIFSLKELEDMNGQEICKLLGITETNLWVKLHRARERLRLCLIKRLELTDHA